MEEYEIEDRNFKDDVDGQPGEEVALELLLRVVADIGIVGLPNAGKSSLLAALTRQAPHTSQIRGLCSSCPSALQQLAIRGQ